MAVADRVRRGPEVKRAAVEDPVERSRDRSAVGGHGGDHEQAHPGQALDQVLGAHPPLGRRDAAQMRAGARRSCDRATPGARGCRRASRAPITEDTAGMIPGVPTTILVAPDSFKGTLTAAEVADGDRPRARGGGPSGRPVPGRRRRRGDARRARCGARRRAAHASPCPIRWDARSRPTFGLGEAAGRSSGSSRRRRRAASASSTRSERDPVAASTFGTGRADHGGDRGGRRRRLPRRRRERDHRRRRRRDPRDPGGRRPRRRPDHRADRRPHAVRARGARVRAAEGRRPDDVRAADQAAERPGPASRPRPARACR